MQPGTNRKYRVISPCEYKGEIVDSITTSGIFTDIWKCFTLFSWLISELKQVKMFIQFLLINHNNSFPKFMNKYIYFSFHSANSFPPVFEMSRINFLYNYHIITYSTTKISYLDSHCFDYDLDTNFKMKYDCIVAHHQVSLSCPHKVIPFVFIRKEMLSNYPSMEICDSSIEWQMLSQSVDNCLNDCQYRYYNYEVKSENMKVLEENTTVFRIKHNNLPDFSVKHIPEMTFISLVCNFGGLLGMWLGLSVLSTMEYIITKVTKIIHNYNQVNPINLLLNMKLYFNLNNASLL